MMKARKKPIEVEVWEIPPDDGKSSTRKAAPPWVLQAVVDGALKMCSGGGALVNTKEGQLRANVRDWIIRDVRGELSSCSQALFEETYELL